MDFRTIFSFLGLLGTIWLAYQYRRYVAITKMSIPASPGQILVHLLHLSIRYQIEITNVILDDSKLCLTYNCPNTESQETKFIFKVITLNQQLLAQGIIQGWRRYIPYKDCREICFSFKEKSL